MGRCNERIDLIQVLFLIEQDSSLEDLILTSRDIGDAGVDHHFLLVSVYELLRVSRLCRIEPGTVNFVVDSKLFLLVFGILAQHRVHCASLVIERHHCAIATCAEGVKRRFALLVFLSRPILLFHLLDTLSLSSIRYQARQTVNLLLHRGVRPKERRLRLIHLVFCLEFTGEHSLESATDFLARLDLVLLLLSLGKFLLSRVIVVFNARLEGVDFGCDRIV